MVVGGPALLDVTPLRRNAPWREPLRRHGKLREKLFTTPALFDTIWRQMISGTKVVFPSPLALGLIKDEKTMLFSVECTRENSRNEGFVLEIVT